MELNKNLLEACTGFDWDSGNNEKSQSKHDVSRWECGQVFFNEPLLIYSDDKHSQTEFRYFALGQTDLRRHLMIVFTICNQLIRIISARPMSKKERRYYEEIE